MDKQVNKNREGKLGKNRSKRKGTQGRTKKKSREGKLGKNISKKCEKGKAHREELG